MAERLFIDDPDHVDRAAHALGHGAVVVAAFANFYVIVSRPAAQTVRRINIAKGRPLGQVGSITTTYPRIFDRYDWSRLDPRLTGDRVRALMSALYGQGPFGFRGAAADHVPDHLTQLDHGVRTTQVIAPGSRCPSNAFFERAVRALGADLLYITSANRSRHLTGAEEEPAHWRAGPLAEDFAHVPELVVIEHRDEAAARAAYPGYAPTSVTLVSFHAPGGTARRPVLTVDRHGSLPLRAVREVADGYGFDVVLGPSARRRLRVREYAVAVPA